MARISRYGYSLCVTCCLTTLLSTLGGCSHRWSFKPPGSTVETIRPLKLTAAENDSDKKQSELDSQKQPIIQTSFTNPLATTATVPTSKPTPTTDQNSSLVVQTESSLIPKTYPVTSATYGDPVVVPTFGDDYCVPVDECPTFTERFCDKAARGWCDIKCDYRHYYSCRTGRDLLLCVGAAAIMANTSIDQDFQDWVQDDVRSSGSDDFASFWKTFGEGEYFVPAWAGLALVGSVLDDLPAMRTVGDFGYRTTRSYLVGTPPMLFMQYCLGASRPVEPNGSQWHPFQDNNGVSGHAFCGAVPFITAAQMSENCCVKGGFYFLSTLTGWSRVNDDSHYLSQAWMGWWMAYLSCRAVSDTEEHKKRCYTVAPMVAPGTVGMLMEYRK